MEALVKFKNCSLGYGNKVVLNNINFEIFKNNFLGIVGPNGVGKTTILKSLLGIIKPINGALIKKNNNYKIGYVPQRGYLDPIYPLTTSEVVLMGRYQLIKSKVRNVDIEKVKDALKYVGIESLKEKLYRELSGGQQQRVLIARALVIEPEILILDEPTNDMDIKSQKNILDILMKLHKEKNITIILVTHLLNEILSYVNKVFLLKQDGYIYGSKEDIINDKNLSKFYNTEIEVTDVDNKKFVIVR